MTENAAFRPETIHAALGPDFYDIVAPAPFPAAILRFRNTRWAARCGLGALDEARWIAHFARFEPLPGSFAAPLALRYHGHQFRAYNPELGDGRGFLFAQLRDDRGRLLDLGTKGSGQTPYSRRGDGRLTLKGGVREVLATAMLEALGVETSKSMSLIETGEALLRNDEPSPTRAAVLVRLSHSHLRIGTFQRLLAQNDSEGMARLLAHAVTHYLPEARRGTMAEEAAAFLEAVAARVARMTAQWFAAGFVHGVLNTDNINITGESFDYGPFRFLPHYEPGFTAAYFDETGLYAFGRQAEAMAWNLARLAECLLLLAPIAALEPALARFPDLFRAALRTALCRRLALAPAGDTADEALIRALFAFLHATKAPFEGVMFDLYGGATRLPKALAGPRAAFYAHAGFAALRAALENHAALPAEAPYFERDAPITLLYDEIEALWAPIAAQDDWSAFSERLSAIETLRQAYRLAD
ncbi:MAG: YdiU family protein [Hyphomicrobiales bacterium]|uniref:protein adenylyltransferase SelO family protein n=1 Tax=Rhabdaerophilum calidifontis TaxID=2604328 RepID=UPI00123AB4DF|nr:YdiU family protein [Rhabdaerophilum calidifontis]MCA1998627.1 YdiU family protein [Hyphomicrobiales bacterium]